MFSFFSLLGFQFPKLSTHPIGTCSITWTTEKGDPLKVKFWYPTSPNASKMNLKRSKYLPAGYASKLFSVMSSKIPGFLAPMLENVETSAYLNAPLSEEKPKWPLIVFSHGLKGVPEIYTAISEQLATNGFVVAAILHTDKSSTLDFVRVSYDDFDHYNTGIKVRVQNVRDVLDNLQNSTPPQTEDDQSLFKTILDGKLDFSKIALCGHSYGGATSVKTLKEDPRPTCMVSLDGWMGPMSEEELRAPSTKPQMFINSDKFQWIGNLNKMKESCRSGGHGGYVLTVAGTGHHNYNDVPLFAPMLFKLISRKAPQVIGPIDSHYGVEISVGCILAFLNRHLHLDDGEGKHLLDEDFKHYPEVHYELVTQ